MKNISFKSSILILKIILISLMILYFFGNLYSPAKFGFDAWSYYEISKEIFSNFNQINTFRQYQIPQPFNISFPPLYPFFISIFNYFFNLGIYSGYFLNFIFLIVTILIILKISNIYFKNEFIGLVISLLLITSPSFIKVLIGADSIPFFVLLFYIAFYLSLKVKGNFYLMSITGIFSGLMFLNRFDSLLASFAFCASFSFIFRKKTNPFLSILIFSFFFFITNSYYFFDNYKKYENIFMSDNSRTVLSVESTYVSDFYESDIIMAHDEPLNWVIKCFKNLLKSSVGIFKNKYSKEIFILVILMLYVSNFNKHLPFNIKSMNFTRNEKIGFCFLIFTITQVFSVFLTGYSDPRYFIHSIIFSFFYSLILFRKNLLKIKNKFESSYMNNNILLVTIILLYTIPQKIYTFNSLYNLYAYPVKYNESHLILNKDLKILERELVNYKKSKLLWLNGPPSILQGPQFGAITGLTIFHRPYNLGEHNLKSFLNSYSPTHILYSNENPSKKKLFIFNLINDNYNLKKSNDFLFEINYQK